MLSTDSQAKAMRRAAENAQVNEASGGNQVNVHLAQLAISEQICSVMTFEIITVCQILHNYLRGKACKAQPSVCPYAAFGLAYSSLSVCLPCRAAELGAQPVIELGQPWPDLLFHLQKPLNYFHQAHPDSC